MRFYGWQFLKEKKRTDGKRKRSFSGGVGYKKRNQFGRTLVRHKDNERIRAII